MIRAVKLALEKNSTARKAAEACNVPESTLQEKMYNIKQGLEVSMSSKLGRCTFTDAYEKKLVDYMIDLDNRLMPLSRKKFLKLAFILTESLKIPHKFSKTTRLTGKDFYYGFLKGHPELSLRKPESTSLALAVDFNKPQVERFFSKYQELNQKHRFQHFQIFNCNETGVTCVHGNTMVISLKGKRQVGKLT